MEEQKKSEVKHFPAYAAILFLGSITVFLGCYLLHKPADEMIRNMIVVIVCCLLVVLSLKVSIDKKSLYFNNAGHIGRFFCSFLFGVVFSICSIFLPLKILPVLVLAVYLALTSNAVTGSLSYLTFLFIMEFFTDMSSHGFFMCMFVGIAGIALFQNLDQEYIVNGALFTSLILLFVAETAFLILFEGQKISLDTFVLPMINVFISFLALLLLLRCYSTFVVHKYRDRYQEINDPDFELLSKLKEESAEAYFHAIHTAYFCDKIARRIGADYYLAKAGGYYHKIGRVEGTEDSFKNTMALAAEYQFPPELTELLKEYGDKEKKITKKETAIVIFADGVISSISYLLKKDKTATLDYKQVVDIVFQKKLQSGLLSHCKVTMEELTIMRKLFVEEKLYYDFLR